MATILGNRSGRKSDAARATDNRELAHAYADAGFEVFPCKERGPKGEIKTPRVKDWGRAATSNHAQIDEWWDRWPNAVVGLPTGERNGIAVIDIDKGHGDGRDGLLALRDLDLIPSDLSHVRAKTAGGGEHVYTRWQAGVTNAAKHLPHGIDIRGEGGYVIAPGSIMADGGAYAYSTHSTLTDDLIGLPAFPKALQAPDREERESANDNDEPPLPFSDLEDIVYDLNYREWCDGGRDAYFTVIAAIHHATAGSKRGMRLARKWASQSPKYNERHFLRDWHSLKSDSENPITVASIIPHAPTYLATQRLRELDDDPEDEIRKQVSDLEWFGDIEPALSSTYLIKGLIDVGSLSVLWGNPKAGKTFLTLDMMFHLAAGLPWRGLRTRKAAVLYLALEGGNRIKNRLVALQHQHGSEPIPFALRRGGADLLKKDGDVKAIIRMVREVQDEYPELPVVVVVDTLSRALAGGDESSSVDMTAFVRNVDTIREKTGSHVMVVHHAGKDVSRGMRGHSSLMAAIDTELFVEHDEETGIRTMRIGVQRDEDTTGQEFRYRLRSVEVGIDQDGDPVRSAVCDPVTDNELCGGDDPAPISGHPAKAFEILQDIASDRSTVPLEEWRNASSASDWLTSIEKGDTKRKTFRRAKEELEKRGWIEMTAKGVRLTDPSRTKFSAADFDDDEPPRGNRRNRNHREDLS